MEYIVVVRRDNTVWPSSVAGYCVTTNDNLGMELWLLWWWMKMLVYSMDAVMFCIDSFGWYEVRDRSSRCRRTTDVVEWNDDDEYYYY